MEGPLGLAQAAVESCLHEGFVDFGESRALDTPTRTAATPFPPISDDHFEDVAADPRNLAVNHALAGLKE